MNYTDYINKDIQCDCGRLHSSNIREIIIKDNAIKELTAIIEKSNYKSIYIAADENTWKAAGRLTLKSIEQAARGMDKRREIKITKHIFKDNKLIADEAAIATLFVDAPSEGDLIIGIGTGTINDLCKLISKRLKIDYAIVVTAPSMDGFASAISMLTLNYIKKPVTTKQPDYIICDLRILCKAPKYMIEAGTAVILGNYVTLTDWNIAELIDNENYCHEGEKLIKKSIIETEEIIKHHIADETKDFLQNKRNIKTIMESLIMSGIAKSFIYEFNSVQKRVHWLSTYWEMLFMQEKKQTLPYGTFIAVNTVRLIKLYEKIKKEQPDFEAVKENIHFIMEEWENKISQSEVKKMFAILEENWDEAVSIIRTLPQSNYIKNLLKAIDMPYKLKHIGISKEDFKNSIKNYTKTLEKTRKMWFPI